MDMLSSLNTTDYLMLGGITVILYVLLRSKTRGVNKDEKKTADSLKSLRLVASLNDMGASVTGRQIDSEKNLIDKMKASGKNMVVFFGSQTGTGEEFAQRLVKNARLYGIRALVMDPEETDMVSVFINSGRSFLAISPYHAKFLDEEIHWNKETVCVYIQIKNLHLGFNLSLAIWFRGILNIPAHLHTFSRDCMWSHVNLSENFHVPAGQLKTSRDNILGHFCRHLGFFRLDLRPILLNSPEQGILIWKIDSKSQENEFLEQKGGSGSFEWNQWLCCSVYNGYIWRRRSDR